MSRVTYRFATKDDRCNLEDLFATAFYSTTYCQWIVPDERIRLDALVANFAPEIRHNLASPGSFVAVAEAGPTLAAGAMWHAPGRWEVPSWRNIRTVLGILRSGELRALPPGDRQAYSERGRAFDHALAQAHPAEPHWYLAAFGCRPDYRGQGLAAPLMRAGLDRAAHDGLPAYLECERALIDMYKRYGFELVQEIPMPQGSPAMFGMWREA